MNEDVTMITRRMKTELEATANTRLARSCDRSWIVSVLGLDSTRMNGVCESAVVM
jgi:hypothetical protein